MNIQWFPGHMTKAIRMMEENLALTDALIYVIDARAPFSCANPLFDKLTAGKNVLYVFNKCDLVEDADLELWRAEFKRQGKLFVTSVGVSGDCREIISGIKAAAKDKLEKFSSRGANASVRAMVVGVPNSGKSTIINAMIKRAKAVTGNKPGVTRGKQWLSLDGVDLLDTPGTLWGKFEDQSTAHHLAYIGSIRDEVLDMSELCADFIDEIKSGYPENLKERYRVRISTEDTAIEIISAIADARGYKLKGGDPDLDRTARTIIDDFRKGRLGKIMLEKPSVSGLFVKTRMERPVFLGKSGEDE